MPRLPLDATEQPTSGGSVAEEWPSPSRAVLRAFASVERACIHGQEHALAALVAAVRELVGRAASGVACVGLEERETIHGTARVAADAADALRREMRQAAWGGTSTLLHADGGNAAEALERLGLSSLVSVPVGAFLPGGGEIEAWFPLALVLVETARDHAPLTEAHIQDVACLTRLIGANLLLSQDREGSEATGRLMAATRFRRLIEKWVPWARARNQPLTLLVIAVEGLAEINEMLGFDAGDGALDDAIGFITDIVAPGVVVSRIGGAMAVALLVGLGPEAAGRIAARLGDEFDRYRAARQNAPTGLSIGIATLDDAMRDGAELVRAGRAAVGAARRRKQLIARWGPDLVGDSQSQVLPDGDLLSGAEYQRILAIWRLFEALSHGSQLDQLIAGTLRALVPLFRADIGALWQQTDAAWVPRTVIDRLGRDEETAASTISSDVRTLIEKAARGRDPVLSRTADGGDNVVVALRRGDEVTGVLQLTRFNGALRAEPDDLVFLGTLAHQVGRVLAELSALGEARRRQQETADRLRRQTMELRRLIRTSSGLIGSHESMQSVFRMVERARASNVPVIATGETGTGKEALARLIHRMSNQRGPFVVVDCGAIPATLLETELFGHEKGAFTGAEARKVGRFEEAHKGTIFLDEIGELSLELQPKLLRVLQESTVRRIGGREEISVDFRLIAATNRDLAAMVNDGTFRRDLYFRMRVLEIKLPPLRDRGDDVLLLALHSLRRYCAELDCDMMPLSAEAEAAMRAYSWPGNVRELQNVLRRALLIAPGPEITPRDLQLEPIAPSAAARRAPAPSSPRAPIAPASLPPAPAPPAAVAAPTAAPDRAALEETVATWFWEAWVPEAATSPPPQQSIESFLLRSALVACQGSLGEAAQLVSMHPETFSSHLERLGAPALSRTLRGHKLAGALEAGLRAGDRDLLARATRALLTELLVYCRGNKSEIARILGWGRQTLTRHLKQFTAGDRTRTGTTDGNAGTAVQGDTDG